MPARMFKSKHPSDAETDAQACSYLFREFAQATFAALVVLMMVSLGGIFADVLSDIARGGYRRP